VASTATVSGAGLVEGHRASDEPCTRLRCSARRSRGSPGGVGRLVGCNEGDGTRDLGRRAVALRRHDALEALKLALREPKSCTSGVSTPRVRPIDRTSLSRYSTRAPSSAWPPAWRRSRRRDGWPITPAVEMTLVIEPPRRAGAESGSAHEEGPVRLTAMIRFQPSSDCSDRVREAPDAGHIADHVWGASSAATARRCARRNPHS